MATTIDINTTTKMLRAALKAAFPGVKFSVRKGTGTGSLWLSVTWVDGPTDAAVAAVAKCYKGRALNADGFYELNPDALRDIDGQFPEGVFFNCFGITTHRQMSEAAEDNMTARISGALGGLEYCRENMEGLVVDGILIRGVRDVWGALQQVFKDTDMMAVSA